MKRYAALLLAGWLAVAVTCWAEPLYEFGFNIRARMRMDSDRNANLLLYSHFGEYSDAHLALYGENRLNVYFAQKLQNFDRKIDPDDVEQAFIAYEGNGWRLQAGKMWAPFGQKMGERELIRGAMLSLPVWKRNTLEVALARNGSGRQNGVFCRFGSRVLGASVAAGENLGISQCAFRFIRGESYVPEFGRGYGLLLGMDTQQVAGITRWQVEAILARQGALPDTEFVIVEASLRLPAGLNPKFRAEGNLREREFRWMVSVQQAVGSGFALYPQVVFRKSDFQQANLEVRASF